MLTMHAPNAEMSCSKPAA